MKRWHYLFLGLLALYGSAAYCLGYALLRGAMPFTMACLAGMVGIVGILSFVKARVI